MNWPRIIVLLAAVAFVALAAALAWRGLRTQPRTPSTPGPALRAAQHRAQDASDPPELAWAKTLDAETLTSLRLAVAAEKAAEANAQLGGTDA